MFDQTIVDGGIDPHVDFINLLAEMLRVQIERRLPPRDSPNNTNKHIKTHDEETS